MAVNDKYKKRLATASYEEGLAMDKAYADALAKGKKKYNYKGLDYAVTGESKTYAADIIAERSAPKPITSGGVRNIPTSPLKQTPLKEAEVNIPVTGKKEIWGDESKVNVTPLGGASNRNTMAPIKGNSNVNLPITGKASVWGEQPKVEKIKVSPTGGIRNIPTSPLNLPEPKVNLPVTNKKEIFPKSTTPEKVIKKNDNQRIIPKLPEPNLFNRSLQLPKYKEERGYTPNIRTTKSDSYLNKGRPLANKPEVFVLHHTAATDEKKNKEQVARTFANPRSEVSSHVVIEEDGERVVYADPNKVTFHAGESEWKGRKNVNDFSVGVEFQGDTNQKPLTDSQIESFIEYARPIAEKHNIPLEEVITHQMITRNKKGGSRKPDIAERDLARVKAALAKTKYLTYLDPNKKTYAMGGTLPKFNNGGPFDPNAVNDPYAQMDAMQNMYGQPSAMSNTPNRFGNAVGAVKDSLTVAKNNIAIGAGNINKKLTDKTGGFSANVGAGLQGVSQGINMIDGMDGKPSTLGGIASGAASGASMGAAGGLPGMAVGAVVGGGLALLQAEKARKEQKKADERYMNNLTDQNNFGSQQTLRNYASQGITSRGSYAYGGDLPQFAGGGTTPKKTGTVRLPYNVKDLATGRAGRLDEEVASVLPGTGEITDIKSLGKDLYDRNWTGAGISAASLALPVVSAKALKAGLKYAPEIRSAIRQAGKNFKPMPNNINKVITNKIDEKVIYPLEYRKEIKELKKHVAKEVADAKHPKAIKRMEALGIDPNAPSLTPKVTYSPNRSWYDPKGRHINIDFRQAEDLKKRGYNLSHKAIFDHEYGHAKQGAKAYALGHKNHSAPTALDYEMLDTNFDFNKSFATDKASEDLDYYVSEDFERTPFLREMRREMLDANVIKDKYQPITKSHIDDFSKKKPSNRIIGFTDQQDPETNKMLADWMNRLPATGVGAGVTGAALNRIGKEDEKKGYAYGGSLFQYSNGGKIHIKPENRGKFTAYKKRTGKTTEEALHSKDPHVRQMANFARNAKKWKHADGGDLPKKLANLPTAQDSTDLYNNALELENYYKGKNYTAGTPTRSTHENVFESMDFANQAMGDKFASGRPSRLIENGKVVNRPITPEEYRKNIDDNKFYQREVEHGIIDTRAPMGLYDKRIKPQLREHYKNTNPSDPLAGDMVTNYKYDPIAVKRWQTMSPVEQQERVRKYGLPEGVTGISNQSIAPVTSKEVNINKTIPNINRPVINQMPVSTPTVPMAPVQQGVDGRGQYIQEVGSSDARLQGDKGYTKYKVKGKVIPANQKKLALGGMPEPEYEVEGGEMIQGQPMLEDGQQEQVASDMVKVPDMAPSHAEGGVEGAGGERVFSDRMKTANKKTYAQEAEEIAKRKGKFEAKIPNTNEAISNTGHRMSERMDMKLDELFNEQEMKKMYAMPSSISSSMPAMRNGGNLQRFDDGGGLKLRPNYYQGNPLYYDKVNRKGAYPNQGYPATLKNPNTQYFGAGQVGNKYPYATAFNPDTKQWYGHTQSTPAGGGETGGSGQIQYSGSGIQTPTLGGYDFKDYTGTGTTENVGGATGKAMKQGNGIPWQYVDNLASGIMTANTPQLAKPYLDPRVNLNTNYDINPQLSSARNTRDALNRSIGASTPQGGASAANRQQLFASSVENENNLYAQKNNIENELKNKEILLNSGINSRNNDKRYAYDQANVERRAGIQQDIVGNASNFALDQYTSARDAKMDARDLENIKQIAMANPNGANYGYDLKAFADIYANDPAKLDAAIGQLEAISPNAPALQYLRNMRKNVTGR